MSFADPQLGDRIEVIDPSWQIAAKGQFGTVISVEGGLNPKWEIAWDNIVQRTVHSRTWFKDGLYYRVAEQPRIDWSEYLELQ